MEEHYFLIGRTPALLLGAPAPRAFLFVHGKGGSREEARAFAQVVCPKGYRVLGVDLPGHGTRRDDPTPFAPWAAVPELTSAMAFLRAQGAAVSVRANSLGAWFSMLAFQDEPPVRCLFVSPVLDMEALILRMMGWADVTEARLQAAGEIPTTFGETLSWPYLAWVRRHPIARWDAPTHILYAGRDELTGRDAVTRFCAGHPGSLTLYEEGEHWFHTPEQLAVLKRWEDSMTGDDGR